MIYNKTIRLKMRKQKDSFPSDIPDGQCSTYLDYDELETIVEDNTKDTLFVDCLHRTNGRNQYGGGYLEMYGIFDEGDKYYVEVATPISFEELKCEDLPPRVMEDCLKLPVEDRAVDAGMFDKYSRPIDRQPFVDTVKEGLKKILNGWGGCVNTDDGKKYCL